MSAPSERSLSFVWQTQKDVPEAVRETVMQWKDGVVLSDSARRLLMLHAQSADRNPHICFFPLAPAEEAGEP